MFRVEFLVQRFDIRPINVFVTFATQYLVGAVTMCGAIWLPIIVVKLAIREANTANGANEMLRMPRLIER